MLEGTTTTSQALSAGSEAQFTSTVVAVMPLTTTLLGTLGQVASVAKVTWRGLLTSVPQTVRT